MINQHEGLFGIYARVAECTSFPSTLFDEPAGSEFYGAVINGIDREPRVFSFKLQGKGFGYDGVFKEAACVGQVGNGGEFFVADGNDCLADDGEVDRSSHFFNFSAQVSVVEAIVVNTAEFKGDVGDEKTVLPFVFKYAIAVGELTGIGIDSDTASVFQVNGFDGVNAFTGFHAVGSDVLYGRCSDMAGYESEVFDSAVVVSYCPCYEVVPLYACPHADFHAGFGFLYLFNAARGRVEYRAREVAREEVVATASEDEYFVGTEFVLSYKVEPFAFIVTFDKVFAP